MAAKTERVQKELEKLPKDAALKVGSKSGYFYCGTVEDFLEHMDEYSFFAERRANGIAKKAGAKLKSALDSSVSPGDYARSVCGAEEPRIALTSQGYLAYLDDYFKHVEKLKTLCLRAEEKRRSFCQIRFRKVVRVEKTTLEENCYVMILSGDEIGGFWLTTDAKGTNISFGTEEDDDG